MKFSQKHIVIGFLLLLSVLVSYSYYYHNSDISYSVELTSESTHKSDSIFSDTESHEDHLANAILTFSFARNNSEKGAICKPLFIVQPSFTIWQPPKIS